MHAMHVLIPFAGLPRHEDAPPLEDLALRNLEGLLPLLSETVRDDADGSTLTPPHERAFARVVGLTGADGLLPWAAYMAQRDGIETLDLAWGLLSPLHGDVSADGLTFGDPESLMLGASESHALFDALRPLFADEGVALVWGAPLRWYIAHESLAGLAAASIDRVIGVGLQEIAPPLAGARLLRRLLSEAQMVLYEHPVNADREQRGRLPVNALWLSGCGPSQPAQGLSRFAIANDLRAPALAGDRDGWCRAWRTIDEGPLRDLLSRARRGETVRLTLAGRRSAVQLDHLPLGPLDRWRRRRRAPAARELLASL
jgi:hypothetical protein